MRYLIAVVALGTSAFAQSPVVGGCPVFPPDNIWNTPVDTLPVHSNSAAYVNSVGFASYMHPDFGSGTSYGKPIGFPFISVPGTQQKYPVYFKYASESDPGPYPVPLNAPIEGGPTSTGDRHVLVVESTNCKLYEMYYSYPGTSSWTASAGAVFDMRSNALRPNGWTSGDAAGLSLLAGLVRYNEVASGEIRHAIRFTAPQTRAAHVWPARHNASTLTDLRYPAMGQRFRLKASFDISSFPPEVQIILRALKKYGMILADNGAPWFISGEPDSRWNNTNLLTLHRITGDAFEAVDVSSLMVDPNSGQARQLQPAVKVSPASASVATQKTLQFTATVSNSTNQAVSWSVNGVAGGNGEVGYISSSGLYSAPSRAPVPAAVQVQAKSTAHQTAVASASVTITTPSTSPAPVILSKDPASAAPGAFSITLYGSGFLAGAVIKVNGAPITTTLLSYYKVVGKTSITAPGVYSVTVTNSDGQVSNATSFTIRSITVSVTPSSSTIKARATQQFTASVANTTDTRVSWSVNGVTGGTSTVGTISSTGLYTAPAIAAPAYFSVTAKSLADTTKIGRATVSVQP